MNYDKHKLRREVISTIQGLRYNQYANSEDLLPLLDKVLIEIDIAAAARKMITTLTPDNMEEHIRKLQLLTS